MLSGWQSRQGGNEHPGSCGWEDDQLAFLQGDAARAVNMYSPDAQVSLDSYQTPARFFVDKNKIILKCIETGKGTKIAKTILKKKKKIGRNQST